MTRIECSCKTCKTNATKIGAALPLAALIPDVLAERVTSKAGRHGLVHIAHDPNAVTGEAARRRTGVVAV